MLTSLSGRLDRHAVTRCVSVEAEGADYRLFSTSADARSRTAHAEAQSLDDAGWLRRIPSPTLVTCRDIVKLRRNVGLDPDREPDSRSRAWTMLPRTW